GGGGGGGRGHGARGPNRAQAEGRGCSARGGQEAREEAREGREGKVAERWPRGPRGGGAREPRTRLPGHPPQRGPARSRPPRPDAQEVLAPRGPGAGRPGAVAWRDRPPPQAPRVHERV